MAATALAIKLRCASWEQLASLYERDIKNNRFFLKSPHPPDPGTEIKIDLTLPSGSLVPLTARVARVVPPPRGPGVDLILIKVPNSVAWLIESALASAQRAGATKRSALATTSTMLAIDIPITDEDDIPITEDDDAAVAAQVDLVTALEAELITMVRMNAYQVLGVGYGAKEPDIRTAFADLSKKYHPDRYANLESEEARRLASEIFVVVQTAYRKIGGETAARATQAPPGPTRERARTETASPPPPPSPNPPPPSPAPPPPPRAGFGTPAFGVPRVATNPVVTFARPQPPQPPPQPPPIAPPSQGKSGLSEDDLFGDLGDPPPIATVPPAVELEEQAVTGEAERLLQAGLYDQALAAYDGVLRASPQHRAARMGRELASGLKLVAAGDKFSAAQHFEAALELDPLNEQASRELGAIRRAATDSRKGLLSKLLGRKP